MPLETGPYLIQNRGRFLDHSTEGPLIPERVIVLPETIGGPKWFVEKVGVNRYTIKSDNGGRTRANEDKIFAITVFPGPEPEVWYITPDEQGGKDSYVIRTEEGYKGWVAPEEPENQIMCQPLILSDPANYPPNATFQFFRIPDE
ncbi:serine protease inhibitor [Moniliophthora roreri MCA 2997]|uniref:Serine protease inhibitor n=2 Tax=Moniliophthora roreri TaxID=221103 RepID=V2X3I8_MONRO|nr:serine protease inhibitor [Moniliophthora roreri MCA 2997]KAI3621096.1 serine protease inhibitor [Moniliophthora roreri]